MLACTVHMPSLVPWATRYVNQALKNTTIQTHRYRENSLVVREIYLLRETASRFPVLYMLCTKTVLWCSYLKSLAGQKQRERMAPISPIRCDGL